jgi:hypothetical protein
MFPNTKCLTDSGAIRSAGDGWENWRPRRLCFLWREHEGGSRIALSPEGFYVELNATAFLVWELSDGSRTSREVVEHVARRCGVQPGLIANQIRQAFSRLDRDGLLRWRWDPLV